MNKLWKLNGIKKNPKKAFPGEQIGFEMNKNRKHVKIKSWCKTPNQAEERTTWFYKQSGSHKNTQVQSKRFL